MIWLAVAGTAVAVFGVVFVIGAFVGVCEGMGFVESMEIGWVSATIFTLVGSLLGALGWGLFSVWSLV